MEYHQSEHDAAARARDLMQQVHRDLLHLLEIVESNRPFLNAHFSSEQAVSSQAAHAFNRVSRSLREHEIVRLYALWQPYAGGSQEVVSVPTLATLTESAKRVLLHKFEDTVCLEDLLCEQASKVGVVRCVSRREKVEHAIARTSQVTMSADFASLKEQCDGHIKHRRTKVSSELNRAMRKAPPRVASETVWELTLETVAIVAGLEAAYDSESTDWDGWRKIFKEAADDLWGSARFDIRIDLEDDKS